MREQAMKLAKVKKSCRTAKTISRVIMVLLLVLTVICAAAAVVCFVFRGEINPAVVSQAVNITFDDVNVGGLLSFGFSADGLLAAGQYAEALASYCVIAAITCALVALIFGTISSVFSYIEKSETPFSQSVLKKLKRTFILLVVLIALMVEVGTALMVGLCLWCIYCILDYGMTLQIEIDETL